MTIRWKCLHLTFGGVMLGLSLTVALAARTPTSDYSVNSVYYGSSHNNSEYAFGPDVRDEKLVSTLMGRDMPYRVFVPAGYSSSTEKYPVLYLLHGLTGHFSNWTDKSKVAEYAAAQKLLIVMPEGDDGWYTDSSAKASDKYESYIIKELIPEIDKKFRTNAVREQRAIAGLSMGGYGALKFGMKYPDMFVLSGSFSGALGAASLTEKQVPGAIGRSIDAIFGPAGSETRKANDLFETVRRLTPEKIKTLPFIYLDCGTEDFLFQNNREFVALLVEKNVPHEYRQMPGAHNWKYWGTQVEEFLEVAGKYFIKDQKRGAAAGK